MARVKRAVNSKKNHRKVLKAAKGYFGARGKHFRAANQQVMKSLSYAYTGRRLRKRDFRRLWITRINAAGPSERHVLFPFHRRTEEVQYRDQPQDACRPCSERSCRLRKTGRKVQGSACVIRYSIHDRRKAVFFFWKSVKTKLNRV